LEDDAIEHWARENQMSHVEFKRIIEDKYIDAITQNLKKEDATLILSDNYDNRVIQFLRENGYYFINTQKMSKDREISAIYDLHIGQYCNNVYILVYESSFSYTLLYRIFEQTKFKAVELNYILN
jgi:malate synthase